jgi:hypothetical protein
MTYIVRSSSGIKVPIDFEEGLERKEVFGGDLLVYRSYEGLSSIEKFL